MQLGQARRKLGQKSGEWTEEKNAKLVRKLDTGGDGTISQKEFVSYFAESLPADRKEFDTVVVQFMEVARACRTKKIAQRKAEKNAPDSPSSSRSPQRGSSKGGSADSVRDVAGRKKSLEKVFAQFDLDDGGAIESTELQALGTARRALGQKQSSWTEEKNARLVRRMDSNGDGDISGTEFVDYFEEALTTDAAEFAATIEQFMEVARACRATKQEDRKKKKAHTTAEPVCACAPVRA